MSGLGPTLAMIVTPAFGLLGVWLVQRNAKKANKTTDTQAIIDQLQEERKSLQEERAADRANYAAVAQKFEDRQQRLETRVENAEGMFRLASDYILSLRYHIAEGKPPPPPPFPAQLTRGLGHDR